MIDPHQALKFSPMPTDMAGPLRAEPTPVERGITRAAQIFLSCVATWLVVLGLFNLRHPSDWAMGDWLINYAGGFVRRGLTGQLALLLRSVHIPLLWTILLLQWTLYGVVLLTAWRLITGLRWTWWRAALFFSPATLAFVLLDPPFAFRKDILFFALLAMTLGTGVLSNGERTRSSSWVARSLLLTAGCAVCLLSHEGLIVFFPYLFAAAFLVTRSVRRSLGIFALPALVSILLFALVSRFPGNAQVASTVCSSIGGTLTSPPSGICGGAIDYLAHDAAYAHQEVLRVILAGRYWQRIPWLFVLPLVPVIMGLGQLWRRDRAASQVLIAVAALAWILSISVFYYGTDWTRWNYIHTFSLMLLLLFAAREEGRTKGAQTSALFATRGAMLWASWGLLLVYCLGWELSTYGQRPLYGSFLRFITHNLARGQQ